MKHLRFALAALLLAAGWAQAQQQGENTSRGNEVHFIAGGALALESSNLEDWAQADSGGVDYDYVSGGIGADLYVGLEFMKWLSLRLGHHSFGDQEADAYGGGFYLGELTVEADGNYFAIDALYPFSEQVLAGITLGSLNWDGEATARNSLGAVARGNDSGRDGFAGLRGRFLFNDGKAAVTAFLNSYTLDTEDTTKELEYGSLGVGLELRI